MMKRKRVKLIEKFKALSEKFRCRGFCFDIPESHIRIRLRWGMSVGRIIELKQRDIVINSFREPNYTKVPMKYLVKCVNYLDEKAKKEIRDSFY